MAERFKVKYPEDEKSQEGQKEQKIADPKLLAAQNLKAKEFAEKNTIKPDLTKYNKAVENLRNKLRSESERAEESGNKYLDVVDMHIKSILGSMERMSDEHKAEISQNVQEKIELLANNPEGLDILDLIYEVEDLTRTIRATATGHEISLPEKEVIGLNSNPNQEVETTKGITKEEYIKFFNRNKENLQIMLNQRSRRVQIPDNFNIEDTYDAYMMYRRDSGFTGLSSIIEFLENHLSKIGGHSSGRLT